jgi:hypothetical protein
LKLLSLIAQHLCLGKWIGLRRSMAGRKQAKRADDQDGD